MAQALSVDSIIASTEKQEAIRILNRAWNHLWLDSEDTRELGLELIVLHEALRRVRQA
jgi:hypothetical protein